MMRLIPWEKIVGRCARPHVVDRIAVIVRIMMHHARGQRRQPHRDKGRGALGTGRPRFHERQVFPCREKAVGKNRRHHHDSRTVNKRNAARHHEHQLDRRRHLRPDAVRPANDLFETVGGVERSSAPITFRPRIKLQMKTGDDAEESGAGAARRPIHFGVIGRAGVAQFAVGADIVDRQHIFAARPADHARVPSEATLQKKAAEADAFAMADREEELLRRQKIVDLVSGGSPGQRWYASPARRWSRH